MMKNKINERLISFNEASRMFDKSISEKWLREYALKYGKVELADYAYIDIDRKSIMLYSQRFIETIANNRNEVVENDK